MMLWDQLTQMTEKHVLCGSTRVTLTQFLERHSTVEFSKCHLFETFSITN